jgi:hypothetical protein
MKTIIISGILALMASSALAQSIVTESTSSSTTNSKSETTVKSPPPTAVAPAVTTINNDVCAVAASGAVQTQILGISVGGTMRDMNCERIKLSKNLYDMGMKVAAVATLCQDERVFAAMLAAGTPCPVDGKIGEHARDEWQARGVLDTAKKEDVGHYAARSATVIASTSAGPAANESTKSTTVGGCSAYSGDDPIVKDRVCK